MLHLLAPNCFPPVVLFSSSYSFGVCTLALPQACLRQQWRFLLPARRREIESLFYSRKKEMRDDAVVGEHGKSRAQSRREREGGKGRVRGHGRGLAVLCPGCLNVTHCSFCLVRAGCLQHPLDMRPTHAIFHQVFLKQSSHYSLHVPFHFASISYRNALYQFKFLAGGDVPRHL